MEENKDLLLAEAAIADAAGSEAAYCKFLAPNDTGLTGSHQSGALISKSVTRVIFGYMPEGNAPVKLDGISICWNNDLKTESTFTWYGSKQGEVHLTCFGDDFPHFVPDETGSLFVLNKHSDHEYRAYILNTEAEINHFLAACDLSPTETNRLINLASMPSKKRLDAVMRSYVDSFVGKELPSTAEMSKMAEEIENKVYDHISFIRENPDKKLVSWYETDFNLYRAFENHIYLGQVQKGFPTVSAFLELSLKVQNSRKSRAGRSLENHLASLFKGNDLQFEEQVVTEDNKKPDFIFPSGKAYHESSFPIEKIVTLAAKTTCKDRWRQVLNEANRFRGRNKYLCTLQPSMSANQMKEMADEKVILVVPKALHDGYPKEYRNNLLSVKDFISLIKKTA